MTTSRLDPAIRLALELRDSLRALATGLEDPERYTADAERADALFQLLLDRGAGADQLVLSKREVGQLAHIQETLLSIRRDSADKELDEDTTACLEFLDPMVERFFAE
jgi:hypothetical protein